MSEHELIHLLRKKQGFFQAILDISEYEHELPVHEWVSALEQKKVLLSCIDEIDHALHPFKAALHSLSDEISYELDLIRNTVAQILHLDTQNQEKRRKELKPYEGA